MDEYRTVETTKEVWAAIRAAHPDMVVFSSFSAPDGDYFGNPIQGKMFTSFGFKGGDFPVIEAKTTWTIDTRKRFERVDEVHKYWLCIPIKEET